MTLDALVSIPAGAIVLHDEGTHRSWKVTVRSFLLAPWPVTREQYAAVLRHAAPSIEQARLPQTDVSWNDAVEFCNLLSRQEGLDPCYSKLGDREANDVVCDFDAAGYRLPTEAEWEFACRAGSDDVRYGDLDAIAWHRGNSGDALHPVGGKAPNAWGLFDTLGNAWEWCWDVYDPAKYGAYRVFRGGGYADLDRGCRASCRRKSHPTFRVEDVGFRVARSGQR